MRRRTAPRHAAMFEPLEGRLCLTSSVGWDGPGQGAAALTYYIANAPPSLSQAATDAALKTALNAWASVAAITFTQTTVPNLPRSIDFTFQPIDGPGGTLAEGYLPNDLNREPLAGDVQFDSSDQWEVGNAQGGAAFDLVLTAVHEIGHTLGLEHSTAPGSVMAESVAPNQAFTGLAQADVSAIRALYAPASETATTTPTTPATAATPTTPTTTPTSPTTNPGTRTGPGFRRLPRFNPSLWLWRRRHFVHLRTQPGLTAA